MLLAIGCCAIGLYIGLTLRQRFTLRRSARTQLNVYRNRAQEHSSHATPHA